MISVGFDPAAVSGPRAGDPKRVAAEKVQAALFFDMLKNGGFAEAFATGSDTLDAMTAGVLERVAEDLAARDTRLADAVYKSLKGTDG